MAASNTPEKSYFDRAVALETEIAERRTDLKAVYDSAKENEAVGKAGVKTLKAAVKLHMQDADKLLAKDTLRREADDLRKRLGYYVDTPLGQAAMKAAQ